LSGLGKIVRKAAISMSVRSTQILSKSGGKPRHSKARFAR
jgi:hypothetical protein